jgi:hypothetical protein
MGLIMVMMMMMMMMMQIDKGEEKFIYSESIVK